MLSMNRAALTNVKKNKAENKNFDTINKNIKLTDKQQKAYKKSLASAQKADSAREKNQQKILGKMRDNSDSYYDRVKKIQNGGTKELKKIEEKYGSGSVKYQKAVQKALEKAQRDHVKTQTNLEKQMNRSVEKETQISAGKQSDILSDLRNNKKKISMASAKEQIKDSKQLRDNLISDAKAGAKETISEANKKYKETTKAADEEYYVNKTISKKNDDELVWNEVPHLIDPIYKIDERPDSIWESLLYGWHGSTGKHWNSSFRISYRIGRRTTLSKIGYVNGRP